MDLRISLIGANSRGPTVNERNVSLNHFVVWGKTAASEVAVSSVQVCGIVSLVGRLRSQVAARKQGTMKDIKAKCLSSTDR